jgi:uncharacterized protein YndB with AHSA1/START domain
MIEVTTHIDASPDRVWELIGDPTRMGEWSPECRRVEWVGLVSAPAAGARFRGHNRIGWRRWTTLGTVATYEPGREIAWDVRVGPLAVARWGFRVEPAEERVGEVGGGCTLTESFTDHRGGLIKAIGTTVRGVGDTETHNRAGMAATLANIKAAAEGAPVLQ